MAVATGINEFTEPDDERLVLDGDFELPFDHHIDNDRLIDALQWGIAHFHATDDLDVAGDALLLTGDLIALPPDRRRDILRICHRITLGCNISHRRWHSIALRVARKFLDDFKEPLDDEIILWIVLMAVFPPLDSTLQNAGCEDGDQFTKAIHLLSFTNWPEGHHLHRFPLPDIQRLVLHALRVLPTLTATIKITTSWRDALTVDKSAKYTTCWRDALIRMMGADHDSTVRSDALQAACEAMQDLDLIAATGSGNDESQRGIVLSEFSRALLAAADANPTRYLRLIFALAESPEWRRRLIMDSHVEKCITLSDDMYNDGHLYLAGFFLRIAPPGQEASCCSHITNEQRWILMKTTWYSTHSIFFRWTDDDTTDIILNLVKGTETYMPLDLSQDDLESFSKCLGEILVWSEITGDTTGVVPAVKGLKGVVDGRLDAARV